MFSRAEPKEAVVSDPRAPRRRAVALALLVTVLWSSSWVLITVGLRDEHLPPLVFAGLRYAMAAAVLMAAMVRRKTGISRDLRWPTVARLAVLGAVFYAVTQGAQFVAIGHEPEATTSLLLSVTPLGVAAVAQRLLSERPSVRQCAGAVLVIAGAVAYFTGSLGATAVGIVAAGVALLGNITSALLGRYINRDESIPALTVTAVSMAFGAAILLSVGVGTQGMPSLSERAWAIVAWLAVVNTAVAFTLWNASLRWLTAVESAAINNTMLPQIALLAWIFLNQRPGSQQLFGLVVVALGIALTQVGASRRKLASKSTVVGPSSAMHPDIERES